MPCSPTHAACRDVLLALDCAPTSWSVQAHRFFPPALRAATVTLLLAAQRQCSAARPRAQGCCPACCSVNACGCTPAHWVGHLPGAVLLNIVRLATTPLSCWL